MKCDYNFLKNYCFQDKISNTFSYYVTYKSFQRVKPQLLTVLVTAYYSLS